MKKIVLTGAAGRLGSYLREPLAEMAGSLVSTDIADDVGKLYPGETFVSADLGDLDAIMKAIEGRRCRGAFRCDRRRGAV